MKRIRLKILITCWSSWEWQWRRETGNTGLGTSCCYSFLTLSLCVRVVLEYGLLRRERKLVISGWKQGSQKEYDLRMMIQTGNLKWYIKLNFVMCATGRILSGHEIYLRYQASRYDSCFVFGRSCVQISNRRAANLTEVSPGFHESLRRISGWTVPGIRTRISASLNKPQVNQVLVVRTNKKKNSSMSYIVRKTTWNQVLGKSRCIRNDRVNIYFREMLLCCRTGRSHSFI